MHKVKNILTIMNSMNHVPKNMDARHGIPLFINSLFMNIPHVLQVEKMMSFNILTPYYDEYVMYNREQIHTKNEYGVLIIFYLHNIYPDDWSNIIEQMCGQGLKHSEELYTDKVVELQLRDSYRGQTLADTVRGTMHYYKDLKMLAFVDLTSERSI